jgi:hypothetical protein
MEYTLGMSVKDDPYHLRVIQQHLTRNLRAVFPDLMEEMRLAFEDSMPVVKDGWSTIKVSETLTQMISRTANRVLVGAPMCRNKEYIRITAQYAIDAFIGAKGLDLIPIFLRP